MIFCFLYRHKLSARVDAGLDLEPALQRHIQECAACRRFHEQEIHVARSLARSAGNECVAAPPFLQARIMAGVERSGRSTHARHTMARVIWGAAGVAFGLLLVVRAVRSPQSPQPITATPDLAQVQEELTALARNLPDKQKLGEWSGAVDQPLDKEMRSLMHDARFAAQGLVNNFVPENLLRSASEEGDKQ